MSEWRPLSFPVLMITLACTTGLLAGCGGDEKVADLATPSTEPASSPVVPPYTTTLKLNDEQKKAADEAVVAVENYFLVLNKVYKDSGANSDSLDEVASKDALTSAKQDATEFQKKKIKLVKPIRIDELQVSSLDGEVPPTMATVATCIPYAKVMFEDANGKPVPGQTAHESKFKFSVENASGTWKVAKQELASRSCS